GRVSSKDVADRAVNVAAGFTEKREDVVSLLQIAAAPPTDQVLLRVRFAEVSRSALTEVGGSLFTSATGIHNTIGRATTKQFPSAQGSGPNIGVSVIFKEFGVRLSFTPTIIGDRVQLKVKPEVSTLDFANAVQLGGFRIPALTTRRTETEIELRDGQTFAIAGLLNSSMNSTLQKIPGIGDIPILGKLFQSKQAQKDRTELVVIITPHILARNSPG